MEPSSLALGNNLGVCADKCSLKSPLTIEKGVRERFIAWNSQNSIDQPPPNKHKRVRLEERSTINGDTESKNNLVTSEEEFAPQGEPLLMNAESPEHRSLGFVLGSLCDGELAQSILNNGKTKEEDVMMNVHKIACTYLTSGQFPSLDELNLLKKSLDSEEMNSKLVQLKNELENVAAASTSGMNLDGMESYELLELAANLGKQDSTTFMPTELNTSSVARALQAIQIEKEIERAKKLLQKLGDIDKANQLIAVMQKEIAEEEKEQNEFVKVRL